MKVSMQFQRAALSIIIIINTAFQMRESIRVCAVFWIHKLTESTIMHITISNSPYDHVLATYTYVCEYICIIITGITIFFQVCAQTLQNIT